MLGLEDNAQLGLAKASALIMARLVAKPSVAIQAGGGGGGGGGQDLFMWSTFQLNSGIYKSYQYIDITSRQTPCL